ncbi:hypothetical protein [Paenibacillus melissococcoides]
MALKMAGMKEEGLEVRDILKERHGNLLCRKVSMFDMGGTWGFGLRHEIWTDREKFEQDIPEEFDKDGSQWIYMSGYAGSTDEKMIELFDQKYPESTPE